MVLVVVLVVMVVVMVAVNLKIGKYKMLEKIIKIAELNNNFDLIALIKNATIDNKIDTFCVKPGSNCIFYNESFLKTLSLQKAYFIFNHEFLHLVYKHCERSKNHKNKIISNIAADIIVNETLEKLLNIKSPKNSCIRTTEKARTFETLYQELLKNDNEENKQPNFEDIGDSEEISEEISEAIKIMASKIEEFEIKNSNIEIKNEKKITLFDFLKHRVGKLIKYDLNRNWQRINRYGLECLPSVRNIIFQPKIDIYIDISGSMNKKSIEIIENLKTIKKQLKNYKANYFVFNTEIKKIDINENEIEIGGGTDIQKVIDNINSKSDLSIVLTDCEDDYVNNNKKVIFISNNLKADIICDENFINLMEK